MKIIYKIKSNVKLYSLKDQTLWVLVTGGTWWEGTQIFKNCIFTQVKFIQTFYIHTFQVVLYKDDPQIFLYVCI